MGASETVVTCGKCGEVLAAPASAAGKVAVCPQCGSNVAIPKRDGDTMRAPTPEPVASSPLRRPDTPGPEDAGDTAPLRAGWICFAVGTALALTIILCPLALPLFAAAFVLSIIALVKRTSGNAIALLLSSILCPTVCGVMAVLLFLGGSCMLVGTALQPLMAAIEQHPVPMTTPAQQRIPSQRSQPLLVPQPAPVPSPQPALREVDLGSLFSQLDAPAKAVARAETTAARNQAISDLRATAQALLAGTRTSFATKLSDVSRDQNGNFRLSVKAVDTHDWSYKGGDNLRVLTETFTFTARLDPDVGLALKPDQSLLLSGTLAFGEKRPFYLFPGITDSHCIARFSPVVRPPNEDFGVLLMKDIKWKFVR